MNVMLYRKLPLVILTAGLLLAVSLVVLMGPARAAVILNDPPAAGHQIIAFPERDFVSASGYAPDTAYTVEVIRNGATVSSATATSDANGLVEVNHPGGACWVGVTPNIAPGDIVRITDEATGAADQTTVANVKVSPKPGSQTVAVIQTNGSTVQIHGTAQDALGNPLPLDQIQQRLISKKDPFAKNGKRLLRSDKEGTLSYDAPGSISWTATYTGLSAADVTRALNSEARIVWLGRDPLAANEQTIFEFGAFGGPQAPCTAPLEGAPPPPPPGPVPGASNVTTLSDPPAAGHQIIAFPERDFVSASGYTQGHTYTMNVIRTDALGNTTTVGGVTGLTPVNDPGTAGFDGLIEVNHPGGGCWVGATPDIAPGDIVRITDEATGAADQTTVANVKITTAIDQVQTVAVVQVNANTVQIHGTAQDTLGNPLPLDQIQQRLISKNNKFDKNRRRDLRSDKEGTLSYDAPGSINWTATYTGLSAADVTRALNSEARVLWLGRDPLAGTEQTIFEFGAFGGPQAPCTAPVG